MLYPVELRDRGVGWLQTPGHGIGRLPVSISGFNVLCQTNGAEIRPGEWSLTFSYPEVRPQSDDAFKRKVIGVGLDLDFTAFGLLDVGDQFVFRGECLCFFKRFEIHSDLSAGIGGTDPSH